MWFIFILIQTESGHPTNQPTITYVLSVQVLNLFSFHFHRLVLCSFLLDALWVDVARNDVAKWKYFMQQKMISKFIFRFSFHFSTMSSKFSVVFFSPWAENLHLLCLPEHECQYDRRFFYSSRFLLTMMVMMVLRGQKSYTLSPLFNRNRIISQIIGFICEFIENNEAIPKFKHHTLCQM